MENVNLILKDKRYLEEIKKIRDFEINREYCNHTIEHFLDVARIVYIQVLEKNIDIKKEVVYAAALLHDIGRGLQYEKGIPHDKAGIIIAKEIISNCNFSEEDKSLILNSIGNHRQESTDEFMNIFYRSDKLSRNCFNCAVANSCKWSDEKKNLKIEY